MKSVAVRSLVVLTSLVSLVGCGPSAVYKSRLVSFSGTPSMPQDQATAVCENNARLYGEQARSRELSAIKAEESVVTWHNCEVTDSYNPAVKAVVHCTPEKGGGGFANGFNNGMRPGRAYDAAYDSAYRGCLANAGWRVERVCVKNC